LIWCPTSNRFLFGKTIDDIAALIETGCVALGSDSRLSGERDLLAELRVAQEIGGLNDNALLPLIAENAARLLRLKDRGALRPGAAADLIVVPSTARLSSLSRTEIELVIVDGVMRYGNARYIAYDSSGSRWTAVRVDGQPKMLESDLVLQYLRSQCHEPGLEVPTAAWKVA
jgi:cytosine/adenosine deaminase-related metal-dependent hydrolase